MKKFDFQRCRVWNLYGPAEVTICCTTHIVDLKMKTDTVPIGLSLPNYYCYIKDHFLQNIIINQEGELFVGGVGVFAGYLGRDDLTAKALVEIDGEMFYRTGDLVRMDHNGLLHYIGRKDHQIKLRGQRIELGEIERCLLSMPFISGCVVMKWGDDNLVAYVQSSTVNEDELRAHCQLYLPPHMVPSFFIILDKLPLNSNGKIDRKQLPRPNPSSLTLFSSSDIPHNNLEEKIQQIWLQVLRRVEHRISTTTNFFSIGGHSLLFIELYHRYQSMFAFDTAELSIAPFLQRSTIEQHAKLLERIPTHHTLSTQWYTLNVIEGNDLFSSLRNLCLRSDDNVYRCSFICPRTDIS